MVLPAVLLLGLGGCVSETREDIPPVVTPGDKQTELTFKVQVPEQAIPGQTRATAADEVISSIDLLLFDNNGDYEDHKTVVVGTMTDNKLTFSIKLDAGTYNVVTIANFATEIATLKSGFVGLNKAGVLDLLATSETGKWNISTTKIPMYGETGTIAVSPGMSPVSMNLTRMLARIDVKVTAPTADFELENILLCNYHTAGYVAPKWNTSTGAIITPAHTDTNIPGSATAVTGASAALVYTPGSQTYEGQIYTFEADKAVDGTTNDAGRINAPCLLVKGKYNGGKSYWYRIDFTKAPTPTEMADPDWDPSQVEYLPLLRNYRYVVDITEASGIGYEYSTDALAAYSVISNLKVRLMCYDEGEVGDIVFNGQYYLGVGSAEVELSPGATISNVLALTNYPGGWAIDTDYGSGTGITYEGLENGWLTPSQGTVTTANGIVKADLVLAAPVNTSGADRVAYVHIKAGRLTHKVKVTQTSTGIRIMDLSDIVISQIEFLSEEGVAPAAESFKVTWSPITETVSISETNSGNPFAASEFSPSLAAITDGSGLRAYTVTPTAITVPVGIDPFTYTKNSLLTFEAGSAQKTLNLVQSVIAFRHDALDYYLVGEKPIITIWCNTQWELTGITGTGAAAITILSPLPTAGGSNTGLGDQLKFEIDDNDVWDQTTVTFTFTDPTGKMTPKTIQFTILACGSPLPIGEGGTIYKTAKYVYGTYEACWMVENSKEGTYRTTRPAKGGWWNDIDNELLISGTGDGGLADGTYGRYYTWEQTLNNAACPAGWRMPRGEEITVLKPLIQTNDPNWLSTDNLGGFYYKEPAGHGGGDRAGQDGRWWAVGSSGEAVCLTSAGSNQMNDPAVVITNAYANNVRCVRDYEVTP